MRKFTLAIVLLLGYPLPGWAAGPGSLTTLQGIHLLTNADASKRPPVAFEATVTYSRKFEKTLFVEDQDAAIYVNATTDLNLVPGDRILIRGQAQESFRPIVVSSDITLLHHGSPPPPVEATFEEMIRTQRDCMYVKVRGVVRSAVMGLTSGHRITRLQLLMDGGYVGVSMDNSDPSKLDGLLDSTVEITGVASGDFDGKTQQVGILIHSTSIDNLQQLAPAPADPWRIPVTPMDQVLNAFKFQDLSSRVRVTGSLTYYYPTSMAILESGDRSIRVLTPEVTPLRVGDQAEAIGIPFVDNGFLTLKMGNIRTTGASAPVEPVLVSWDQVASGKHSFDLISIEGTVVSQVREHAQDVYVIAVPGDHLFSALVRHPFIYDWGAPRPPLPPMPKIQAGSTVRVTGVAQLDNGNPYNGAVAFQILMRSFDDFTVVAPPTPMNVQNLTILVGLLVAVVVAIGLRGWVVERRMRRQSATAAYAERRRGKILEDINGTKPLTEILEKITELVSFKLGGSPSWCHVADGPKLGNCPPSTGGMRVVAQDIAARTGPPLGTLYAAFDLNAKPDPDELETLSMAASLSALAIETRRLYSDLLRRSEYDLLTNVHNRFSLEKQIDMQIDRAEMTAGTFGLVYIDLDHFKSINDRYGHKVGDEYLQQVTLRMKRQLRAVDVLARIGGDEFVALVPDARCRADVEEIANRIERCFEELFHIEANPIRGAASTGIALCPEDGNTKDALLNAADARMYGAKHAKGGRSDRNAPAAHETASEAVLGLERAGL
jgi:diguanylate cyclase (GGDEF)-like protein